MDQQRSMRRHGETEGNAASGHWALTLGVPLLAFFVGLVGAIPAQAIPSFARREGQPCSLCHSTFPKLNSTGMEYKSNGFRFPGEQVQNVWDMRGGPPVAMIAEIEAFIDHSEEAGTRNSSDLGPDIKVDEIEIMAAGNFSSRVSGFTELEFDWDGNANANVGPTWAQVNDLVGEKGEGVLNLRVGKMIVDLPFLSQDRRVVRNNYLANEMMGFLADQTGAELNGYVTREMSGDRTVVHRYGFGVSRAERTSVDQGNAFRRGFAYYAIELPDDLHFGAIVQGGENSEAPASSASAFVGGDMRYVGFLAAAEKNFETACAEVTLDLFYGFRATHFEDLDRNRDNQNYHNVGAEVLISPSKMWTFGTRVDWLIETEQARQNSDGWRLSQLARMNVIENAWLGLEYRHEEGGKDSPVTMTYKRTDQGRLFLAVAF